MLKGISIYNLGYCLQMLDKIDEAEEIYEILLG